MPGKLRVTQIKSSISHIARNRATLKALGLHGIGSSVEVVDNDATRGMVRQVRFLVSVEEPAERAVAGKPDDGQGGGEHASERTPVRERASAADNASSRRMAGDEESSK